MLVQWFIHLDPILQALVATGFTWLVTALGAALVFFFKSINRRMLNGMLGFAAGVMVAASFWSLLAPAIEMAGESGGVAWVPAVVGFMLGGLFLLGVDKILPHLHLGYDMDRKTDVSTMGAMIGFSVMMLLDVALG